MSHAIICKVCDSGRLREKSPYRMSGIVVFIGYILIIPSVVGICLGAMTLLGLGITAATPSEYSDQTGAFLAVAGATGFMFILAPLLLGLLGWLLVMKKSVLQCNACGAVVPAS